MRKRGRRVEKGRMATGRSRERLISWFKYWIYYLVIQQMAPVILLELTIFTIGETLIK